MGTFIAFCAIPALLALVGALVIFSGGSKRNMVQKFLASGLLVLALGMSYTFVFQIPALQHAYLLDWFLTTAAMLPAPLFYMYLCRLTGTGNTYLKSAIFIPAALVSAANLILYFWMGPEDASQYFYQVTTTGSLGDAPSSLWVAKRVIGSYIYRLVLLVPAVLVMVISFKRVKLYHREVEDFHANADEKYFRADTMAIASYIALTVGVLFYSALPFGAYIDHPVYLVGLSIAIGAGVALLTYYGLKQNYTADDLKKLAKESPNYDGRVPRSELLRRLDAVKDTELCFDPEITVVSLAERLGTDATTLSDLIGKRYGMSFSHFINDIRIKKALVMMRDISPNTPLTQVSRKCGYETYASFARNFQLFAHTTPSEWMRRYRQRTI